MIPSSCGLVRSLQKLNTSYIHLGENLPTKQGKMVTCRDLPPTLRVLTLARRVRMQTLKSSPTSCILFLLFLLVNVFWETGKSALHTFIDRYPGLSGLYQSYFIGHTGKYLSGKSSVNKKFCVWEHDISCALEKLLMVEVCELMKSCFSTS